MFHGAEEDQPDDNRHSQQNRAALERLGLGYTRPSKMTTVESRPRLPIVGVMGSGTQEHAELAQPVGRWLAGQGVHLLTGGGAGVMASVSRAFYETAGRKGLVIGIVPGSGDHRTPRKPGYPNPWVEIPIFTHLPLTGVRGTESLSRNHINVLSSDVILALPGSAGTASEIRLALSYQRPVIAYLGSREDIPGLPPEVELATELAQVQEFATALIRDFEG